MSRKKKVDEVIDEAVEAGILPEEAVEPIKPKRQRKKKVVEEEIQDVPFKEPEEVPEDVNLKERMAFEHIENDYTIEVSFIIHMLNQQQGEAALLQRFYKIAGFNGNVTAKNIKVGRKCKGTVRGAQRFNSYSEWENYMYELTKQDDKSLDNNWRVDMVKGRNSGFKIYPALTIQEKNHNILVYSNTFEKETLAVRFYISVVPITKEAIEKLCVEQDAQEWADYTHFVNILQTRINLLDKYIYIEPAIDDYTTTSKTTRNG